MNARRMGARTSGQGKLQRRIRHPSGVRPN